MTKVLTAARLITADRQIEDPVLVIEDATIRSFYPRGSAELPAGEHLHYPDATLTAAYVDVHLHGCCGLDVMTATPEVLGTIGGFLARHGVGAYFPTTITAPKEATLRSLAGLAKLVRKAGPAGETSRAEAHPLGIHIEGPFLSHEKKGAHPQHDLLVPSVEFFDRMWEASEGTIRLMTVAPELPNALEVTAHAAGLGVRVSLGHSNATYAEAVAGRAQGAVSATHTFNAMRALDQREPGILGLVLSDDGLYAELICDGLHVHPAAVRLFWKAKGAERGILITDAMSATGMPDGLYKLGELEVRLVEGRCLIGENTLAGSTLTLDAAVRNFARFAGTSIAEAVQLASRNPARMAGLGDQAGSLREGGPADLVVLSPEGAVLDTWLGGRRVS